MRKRLVGPKRPVPRKPNRRRTVGDLVESLTLYFAEDGRATVQQIATTVTGVDRSESPTLFSMGEDWSRAVLKAAAFMREVDWDVFTYAGEVWKDAHRLTPTFQRNMRTLATALMAGPQVARKGNARFRVFDRDAFGIVPVGAEYEALDADDAMRQYLAEERAAGHDTTGRFYRNRYAREAKGNGRRRAPKARPAFTGEGCAVLRDFGQVRVKCGEGPTTMVYGRPHCAGCAKRALSRDPSYLGTVG